MNKYWFYKVGLVVVFLCFALLGGAKVKLPTLVSDGMVLQNLSISGERLILMKPLI